MRKPNDSEVRLFIVSLVGMMIIIGVFRSTTENTRKLERVHGNRFLYEDGILLHRTLSRDTALNVDSLYDGKESKFRDYLDQH